MKKTRITSKFKLISSTEKKRIRGGYYNKNKIHNNRIYNPVSKHLGF